MITKFDKASLGRVRCEVDKSLSELGEKLGITLQIGNISYQDRQRLRKIVRKVHLKFLPDHLVNNKECDKLIESLGPMVREKLLKEYIEKVV